MIYHDPPELIWTYDKYYSDIFIENSIIEWQKANFELFLQNCDTKKQIVVSKRSKKLSSKVCYLKFYFKGSGVVLNVWK